MKKNRNAFFNESNTSFQGYNPGFMPYQMNANSSFSAGNMMMPNMAGNDYEERLAKIERQIEIADALTRFACMIEKEEKYLALLQRQKAYLLNAMFI